MSSDDPTLRRSALDAAIDKGARMPRTLPRDPAMREVLEELGERPERLGPPAAVSARGARPRHDR